jgi:K+-sensing histidine kinase KdpD
MLSVVQTSIPCDRISSISSADAFEVVDISPNMLIQRLKAGKVYKKERLETAFSKGIC